jgi:hypothetical protein
MRAVRAGWVTYSASAARLTLPVRATSMKAWTCPNSTAISPVYATPPNPAGPLYQPHAGPQTG